MRCIICDAASAYYFSKDYADSPFAALMADVGPVDYFKCSKCGFVLSKTHGEMPHSVWSRLNRDFHDYTEDPASQNLTNQPPYPEQAMMLSLLGRAGLVSLSSIVDYAGGQGTLAKLLRRHFDITQPIYDPYVVDRSGGVYADDLRPGAWAAVINSAMFEHIRTRDDLDAVQNAASPTGALIFHTVVCERVPPDPDWFYLIPPVHCAFHTNASMGILMRQWGYRSSIYCPPAKCWTLLRSPAAEVAATVAEINREVQSEWFIAKAGFVDYWKGF